MNTVWTVWADALHSRTYKGRVELGTYFVLEEAMRREAHLLAEGYKNLEIEERKDCEL